MTLLHLLFLTILLTSCELIEIGSSRREVVVERNQLSSVGVVYLWKAEIDSSNLTGASELMRHRSGRALLASERYDMADDLQRWKSLLAGKPITSAISDTINDSTHTVRTKMDYIRSVTFNAVRHQGKWWVSNVE